jgi:non-specific serine/threonine protein kinase
MPASLTFGDLLRQHRLAAGLTQEALAERAGLSVHGIQKLERGVTRPYRDTVQRLMRALQLSGEDEAVFRTLAQPTAHHRPGSTSASASDVSPVASDLPVALTSFIGREADIAEVGALLSSGRLITLTGVGGCGKTRLAFEVARVNSGDYPDGVWLVELASLTDVAQIPQAVASALSVREVPTQPLLATVIATLRPRRPLLLLDNCEHLLDACAYIADALLRACPRLKILATSREALGLTGEIGWRVPSLPVPPVNPAPAAGQLADYAAARLFVERAHAAHTSFAITSRNAETIAGICTRLDGIPLALELAAVLVRGMSVEDVAMRLDHRFRLLTGGSRAALPRQQTLRATIDWSYQLLSPPERLLFAGLSVFAGRWTLEAAEAVCSGQSIERDDVLALLLHLVDKSLVVAESDDEAPERYHLLETLRQYGREQLVVSGQADATHDRHAAYYLALAQLAETELPQTDSRAWTEWLETEEGDLGAALEWFAGQGNVESALLLAGVLSRLWVIHNHLREGRRRLSALLDLPGAAAPTLARAKVLDGAGVLAYLQADPSSALRLLKESLALYRKHRYDSGVAWVLIHLAWLCFDSFRSKAAQRFVREALALCYQTADRQGVARCLNLLGMLAWARGDIEDSCRLHQESLAIAREVGDWWGTGWALIRLGVSLLVQVEAGQVDARSAEAVVRESLGIWRDFGDRRHIAFSMADLGVAMGLQGDFEQARLCLEESLSIFSAVDDNLGVLWVLWMYPRVLAAEGHPERAVCLLSASLALMANWQRILGSRTRTPVALPILECLERYQHSTCALFGADIAATALARGQAMSLEQAVAYARSPST